MAKILIQGVAYDVPETYTYRELSTLKKIAGTAPADGYSANDPDFQIGVAMIVLKRAGQEPDVEKLYALEVGSIADAPEDDDPPAPLDVPETQPETQPEPPSTLPDTPGPSGPQD